MRPEWVLLGSFLEGFLGSLKETRKKQCLCCPSSAGSCHAVGAGGSAGAIPPPPGPRLRKLMCPEAEGKTEWTWLPGCHRTLYQPSLQPAFLGASCNVIQFYYHLGHFKVRFFYPPPGKNILIQKGDYIKTGYSLKLWGFIYMDILWREIFLVCFVLCDITSVTPNMEQSKHYVTIFWLNKGITFSFAPRLSRSDHFPSEINTLCMLIHILYKSNYCTYYS